MLRTPFCTSLPLLPHLHSHSAEGAAGTKFSHLRAHLATPISFLDNLLGLFWVLWRLSRQGMLSGTDGDGGPAPPPPSPIQYFLGPFCPLHVCSR